MPSNSVTDTMSDKLLTEIIDSRAVQEPDTVWLRYPSSDDDSRYQDVTYSQLAAAVNTMAWLLHEKIPKTESFEPVVYIGPQDARYPIFAYACIKAGFKAVLVSPRNSKSSNLKLMESLNCSHLVTTEAAPPAARQLQEEDSIQTTIVPSLDQLFSGSSKPFPFDKTFEDAKKDPFLVLHTSGSTGEPKPITYTHEFWARNVKVFQVAVPQGYESMGDLFQESKMAGFCFVTIISHFFRTTVILPPSNTPPSIHTLARSVEHAQVDWAAVAPSIIEDLGRDADLLLQVSKKLKCLAFGGGKPSVALGDKVSRRVRIHNLIGSSECGGYAQLLPEKDTPEAALWSYVSFPPHVNARFYSHSDDLHELVIERDQSSEGCQPVFLQFPDQPEFRTSDLFHQHPDFPGFWQHQGRIDDLVVFSTGEKINPVGYEQQIASHPDVASVLVFGSNQQEAGLLVEPRNHDDEPGAFVDKIWDAVQAANETAPGYARVARSHICVASSEKPIPRSGKGTVRRHQTIRLYEDEIAALYEASDGETEGADSGYESHGPVTDIVEIRSKVRGAILDITKAETIQDQDDIFGLGVDSLQVNHIVRRLQSEGIKAVNPRMVYENSTVEKLVETIHQSAASAGEASSGSRAVNDTEERLSTLKQMLDFYTEKAKKLGEIDLYQMTGPTTGTTPDTSTHEECILLTGTTGYLGSYILDHLVRDTTHPRRKIICLNRTQDGSKAQANKNKQHDGSLLFDFPADRVEFLSASFDHTEPSPDLGLSTEKLGELLDKVTAVVHTAWPVDFNLPLSGFKSSLNFMLNLVRFCQQARHSPPMLLVSSIASVMHMSDESAVAIPETMVSDLNAPVPGYGESKFIAEHILHQAMSASDHNFTASVVRVGQLAGPQESDGLWNKRDWLARLVRSSLHFSAIPTDLGVNGKIDWVPIDLAGRVILDIAAYLARERGSFKVFQLLNHSTTTWSELMPEARDVLNEAKTANFSSECKGAGGRHRDVSPVEAVTGKEWLERLHRSEPDDETVTDESQTEQGNPALDLVDFFDGILAKEVASGRAWATDETAKVSTTFRRLDSIKPKQMRRWVAGWVQGNDDEE